MTKRPSLSELLERAGFHIAPESESTDADHYLLRSNEPARKTPSRLGDRLPQGYQQLPLDKLIEEVSKHAKVDVGTGASESEVQALEAWAKTTFPDDYREFLRRFGRLSIIGDTSFAFGRFEVYGERNLSSVVEDYRDEFASMIDDGDIGSWLKRAVPLPKSAEAARAGGAGSAEPEPSMEEKRRALCEKLSLSEQYISFFADDVYDELRIAYQYMVPIMATPDMLHHAVHCVGPGARMFTVSIKGGDVSGPAGTFLSRFHDELADLIVLST